MSKVKAKREPQKLFRITFNTIVGDPIELRNVMVKEIDLGGEGYHWMELTRKGDRWLLLKTPGYVFEPMVTEPQVINLDRTDPDKPKFIDYFQDPMPIAVHTQLNCLGRDRCFYVLDEINDGTRIQYTDNFLVGMEHSNIDNITIELQQ